MGGGRGFWPPGPFGSWGPQPRPPRTPLPCLWGWGASTSSGAGGDEVGFEGLNEVGDYDEYEDEYVMEGEEKVEEDYEVDYEYVDLQKDSDGDGLRTPAGLPMTRCNEMSRTE